MAGWRGRGERSPPSAPRTRKPSQAAPRARPSLRGLEKHGPAGPSEARELEGYPRKPLPDELRRFLQFLAPTHRPSTVRTYRAALRRFHEWLGAPEGAEAR